MEFSFISMKIITLTSIFLLTACSSTFTTADLQPVSPRMSCAQIIEQLEIADQIIAASSSQEVDTQIARSGVNVATQAASIGGAGPIASIGNSLFGLGAALYKSDNSGKRAELAEAQDKKTQLQDLYYDKEC